jgi:hypothetical protein
MNQALNSLINVTKKARYFCYMAWHMNYACSVHFRRSTDVPYLQHSLPQQHSRSTVDSRRILTETQM